MSQHAPFAEVQASRPDFDPNDTYRTTKAPNPAWKSGDGLGSSPEAKPFQADGPFREIEPGKDLNGAQMYKMMTWGIAPRPVAFVSTMSKEGHTNLAPISWFNHVSADPPSIMVSISGGKPPTGRKDTARNIIERGQFCVSLISEPFVEAANFAAIDCPEEQSEWPLTGLTKRASRTIDVPHVAESAFSMECELTHQHDIENDSGSVSSTVFIGRVRRFHVKEHVIDPEDPDVKIMPEEYRVIARLGGWSYGRVSSGYEIPRPVWEKEKEGLEQKGLTGIEE